MIVAAVWSIKVLSNRSKCFIDKSTALSYSKAQCRILLADVSDRVIPLYLCCGLSFS